MRKIEKITIVGTGGIGAAYGSYLFDMNPKAVKILADEERMKRYQKDGFIINGKQYHFEFTSPDEKVEPADLILVAVKFHHLEQAIKDMKSHVGPNTIILSLLNGISSEEIIGQVYGMEKLLYGMCVSIDAVRTNTNVEFSSIGQIHFGEKSNDKESEKVKAVQELFDRAKIPYVIPENILRTIWWKFMFNVAINQLSAVLKAPYKAFQNIKHIEELMDDAMREVVALSKENGIHLTEEDVQSFHPILHKLAPEGKTSMCQDMEAGRKTEVEMLAGTVCELGKKYNVPTPINDMLFKMIKTMEQMNQL